MIKFDLQRFGGRGATDDLGGNGGGDNGVSSYDKGPGIVEFDAKDDKAASEAMAGIEAMREEYPGVMDEVADVFIAEKIKTNDGSVPMAFYGADGLGINEKFANSKKMDAAYDMDVKAGFHPGRGGKSGLEAVVSHELGHAITNLAGKRLGQSLDQAAKTIVKRAANAGKFKTTTDLAAAVSGYAKQSHAECVAEAVADVHCNGSTASAASKAIVNQLNKVLSKRR